MHNPILSTWIFGLSLLSALSMNNTEAQSSLSSQPDFSFTRCKSFEIIERKVIQDDWAHVENISYPSCAGKILHAYWIKPNKTSTQKAAGILFVHWFEPHANNSNREEFFDEARELTKQNVASLLVSTFWSEPNADYHQRRWQDDYENTLNQTRDLLRALAFLRAQPEVDLNRIGYVGHDYGAGFGCLVAGIDTNIKAINLMASPSDLTDWYLYGSASGVPTGNDLIAYKKSFDALNPATMLAKSNAKLFLQFAQTDQYVSQTQADKLRKAVAGKSENKIYATDHAMNIDQVRKDREAWLNENLLRN